LTTWQGPDAARFEELWLVWGRAAWAVCASLGRTPTRVPRPRSSPEVDPASLDPSPTWVLAQMHAWQRDVGDLARDLEDDGEAQPGDWRMGLAELVTVLARLRGVVSAGASSSSL